MNSIIEQYRKESIEELFAMNSFKNSFPIWKKSFDQIKQNKHDHVSLKDIGESLRAIFKQTGAKDRGQGTVSAGGAAWEGIVCWYLNLLLIGTNCVVVKQKKKLVPESISKALTVMYGNTPSNTESDLIAITFPNNNKEKSIDDLFKSCESHFSDIEVCVIQCKTNWNDNSQIPMLWDIIYNSAGALKVATVGIGGFSIESLQRFSYAFVTVPSQKDENITKFKLNSTHILRVNNLSGGNYWGMPSKNGIALSLNEMLTKNFNTAIGSLNLGWHKHIDIELAKLNADYSFFQL